MSSDKTAETKGWVARVIRFRLKTTSVLWREWRQHRTLIRVFLGFLILAFVCVVVWRHWAKFDCYLLEYGQDVTRQLAIAIGAAITGLVAIVFSLTLFAIQRAADKGTPAIFEEFSRDSWLWLIYWALVLITVTCFGLSLLPISHTSVTLVAVCEFALICATFRSEERR